MDVDASETRHVKENRAEYLPVSRNTDHIRRNVSYFIKKCGIRSLFRLQDPDSFFQRCFLYLGKSHLMASSFGLVGLRHHSRDLVTSGIDE